MSSLQYEIINVLKRARSLDTSPAFKPYSGVEIVIDEDTYVTAPSDPGEYEQAKANGRILTIENPWGTQAQADAILNAIKGYAYQPFEASDALVDPSAEIGDGVSINDVYSGIFQMTRNYSALMPADVSAPQSEEIDHEYPYEPAQDRQIQRRFSAIESEFRIQSDVIAAKVSKTSPEGQTSFSWSLQDSSWEVKSNGNTVFKVTSSGAEVNGKITATSGQIGAFTLTGNTGGANKANALIYNDIYWGCWERSGIYIGAQGIQVGKFHKPGDASQPADAKYIIMRNDGTIEAQNMLLRGTLTLQGTQITAANLRTGAVSGNNYGIATAGASVNAYPAYFHCGTINVHAQQIVMDRDYVFTPRYIPSLGLFVLATGGVG